MADESQNGGHWWGVVVALLLLPVLYVLSMGPVARFATTPGSRHAAQAFYAPLVWLHDSTPLKGPLEWYVELWGVK
jgi:hypothetical protein